MAADDRVRSLLESESSLKGKGRGKGKGKNKTFDRQKLYSLHQDYNGSLSEDQIGQVMLQKKVKSPSGSWGKNKHVESNQAKNRDLEWRGDHRHRKEVAPRKKQDPTQTSKSENKGKSSEKGKQANGHPFQRRGKRKSKKQERFHKWRIQQRVEKCTLRQSLSYQRARYRRCFEHLVAEAGMSCLYSCHQWHRVEEAVYF